MIRAECQTAAGIVLIHGETIRALEQAAVKHNATAVKVWFGDHWEFWRRLSGYDTFVITGGN